MSEEPGGGGGHNFYIFLKGVLFSQRRISIQWPKSQMKEGNAKIPTGSLKSLLTAHANITFLRQGISPVS